MQGLFFLETVITAALTVMGAVMAACMVMFADMGTNDAAVWIAAISGAGALVTSILARIKIGQVEHQFNHRVDELITAAEARGVLRERVESATALAISQQKPPQVP